MSTLRAVDVEDAAGAAAYVPGAHESEPVVAAATEAEFDTTLPRDHPRWVRDAVALSKAARDAVARMRPIFIAVMSIWDHPLRCIAVGGRRLSVDPSGSYRIEF